MKQMNETRDVVEEYVLALIRYLIAVRLEVEHNLRITFIRGQIKESVFVFEIIAEEFIEDIFVRVGSAIDDILKNESVRKGYIEEINTSNESSNPSSDMTDTQ